VIFDACHLATKKRIWETDVYFAFWRSDLRFHQICRRVARSRRFLRVYRFIFLSDANQTAIRLADSTTDDSNVHRSFLRQRGDFFQRRLSQKKWHRVWAPHIGVFFFATMLLIATILHWDRFNHAHPVFWLWVFIYVLAPVLVPWALIRNLPEDPNTPDAVDAQVPLALRLTWFVPGLVLLAAAVYGFIKPAWLIPHWPWKATPLTMRVMMSFYSMVGVAVFTVLREPRWSAWRIGTIGVIVWHALIITAGFLRQGDFKNGLFYGWWFPFEAVLLIAAVLTFAIMECRAAKQQAVS